MGWKKRPIGIDSMASEVTARLGLAQERVMRRASESKDEPDVFWQCEHISPEARQADVQKLTQKVSSMP